MSLPPPIPIDTSPGPVSDGTSQTPFKTPDITSEDIAVFVGVLATIATTLGVLDISDMQKATLTTILVALWGAFQLAAGAVRRHGRAKIAVAHVNAASNAASDALFAAATTPTPVRRSKP